MLTTLIAQALRAKAAASGEGEEEMSDTARRVVHIWKDPAYIMS
jgi:hypothetical protein